MKKQISLAFVGAALAVSAFVYANISTGTKPVAKARAKAQTECCTKADCKPANCPPGSCLPANCPSKLGCCVK